MKLAGYIDSIAYTSDAAELLISGWAANLKNGQAPDHLYVYVGEKKIYSTSQFAIPRGDVAEFFKIDYPNALIGFNFSIKLDKRWFGPIEIAACFDEQKILIPVGTANVQFIGINFEKEKNAMESEKNSLILPRSIKENWKSIENAAKKHIGITVNIPQNIVLALTTACNYKCIICNQDHYSKTFINTDVLNFISPAMPLASICLTG